MGATALVYGATEREVERAADDMLRYAEAKFGMTGAPATAIRPLKTDEWPWVPEEWRKPTTLAQWVRID